MLENSNLLGLIYVKVSIITATWNSEATIKTALDSLCSQDYLDIEHIVVDGKSSDDTLNLVEQYGLDAAKISCECDDGLYDALNKGINLASGDIVGFLHSDDLLASESAISNIVSCFNETGCDAVYGDLQYVAKDNVLKIIRFWKSRAYTPSIIKRGWMPPHPTFFMKREHYEKLGSFDTSYRISADYDALLRYLLSDNFQVHYMPSVISKMRVGGISNGNLGNVLLKMAEDARVMKSHGLNVVAGLIGKNISKLSQFL